MRTTFSFLLLVLLVSCAKPDHQREDYGDISQGPSGIVLADASEHQGGWGRKDCLTCHNARFNIHRRAGANMDVDALNADILAQPIPTKACMTCHGKNGTEGYP